MPEPDFVPDRSSSTTDEQVRTAFHRAAADAELRASPLPPHEITKRGDRRMRLRYLSSTVGGAAAAVAIVVSVAVLTREPQTVLPGAPAPSQLIAPSFSPSSESSAPADSSAPPESGPVNSNAPSTTTPTESR